MSRIDVVIFDLDGTLVRYHGVDFESSWGAVAVAAGVADASRRLKELYFPRREAYAEWVAAEAHLLAGLPVATVEAGVFPPPYAAGVRQAVAALRGRVRMGVLSSGVGLVADRVAEELGLDFVRANQLGVENGRFTGTSEIVVPLWDKESALEALAEELGFSVDRVCFIGDHMNDLPVLARVGLPIAANPKDVRLHAVAAHVIEDFAGLPALIAGHNRSH